MRKLLRAPPQWLLPLTFLVGLVAAAAAWQIASVHGAIVFVAILMLIWFVCWMCAFLLLLRSRNQSNRDKQRAAQIRSAPAIAPDPALTGTV